MSTISSFFRSVFSRTQTDIPPDSFSTTLHDAMRLNEQPFDLSGRTEMPCADAATPQVSVLSYDGAADLRAKLGRLDGATGFASRLNVVLVLDEHLQCDLASLLERDSLANRLVVVKSARRLPGLRSMADLALLAPKLGWLQIEFGSNLAEEIHSTLESLDADDRLVVLRPRSRFEQ